MLASESGRIVPGGSAEPHVAAQSRSSHEQRLGRSATTAMGHPIGIRSQLPQDAVDPVADQDEAAQAQPEALLP